MPTHTDRSDFLGVDFDTMPMDRVVDELAQVTSASRFGYLVTPNVDHLVRLEKSGGDQSLLRTCYARADFCVCDSRVLARLARLTGLRLPVVAGSDLVARLFEEVVRPGDKIAIIGGDELTLRELQLRFPHLVIVQQTPPMDLRTNPQARSQSATFIADQNARFAFLAVGSPQQEMIAEEASRIPGATGMALCIGAGLDFLVARRVRAPRLVRSLGLEWAHRLASEPRRMWRRYLVEGPRIFLIAWRWRQRRQA